MKIIFMGTPEFGSVILSRMVEKNYKPTLVITNPDKPSGRGKKITESDVSKTAKDYNLPLLKPEKVADISDEIKKIDPDLIVIAAYGQYIPAWMIDIPKYKVLNIHPSLLPKYRGPSPIQYAILNGDRKTGVTIMLINEEMDKGDILSQREYKLTGKETYQELLPILASIGADLLIETIPRWIEGKIKSVKQDESKAIYSKILTKYDGKIDWKNDAEWIERQVRAFNPWPGSYTFFNFKETKEEKLLKVLKGEVLKQTEHGPFGPPGKTYAATNGDIAVQTGKDFFIIKKFQIEGGNPTVTADYLKNKLDLIGLILK